MAIIIFLSFIATAALAFASKDVKRVRTIALIMGVVNAALATYFLVVPLLTGQILELGSLLRVDRFSAFIGLLITLLYLLTSLVSYRYVGEEHHENILNLNQIRLYYVLLPIFALAMLTVVMADNLGLLWLALEATTLATTPLVAIYKKDGSLEAAWKYIILCSLGISLGLLGLLLISYAGISGGLAAVDSLSLKALAVNAAKMLPSVVQWAFLFVFIGLGTKVGFFPLHTWLPDAHGRTPSPISAMLSGILLNVAFYSLMRIKYIADVALGGQDWTNNFFLIFGIMSVVASAFYLYIQHHYKRMLAYSSMEHMGILAIAIGLGPIGIVPALMHMFAHTLSKSLLFYASGEILLSEKTAKIDKVKNLFTKIPKTSVLFVLGMLSLLAAPPFATFSSEILILSVAVNTGHWVIFFMTLLALSLVCVSLFKHTMTMFALDGRDEHHEHGQEEHHKKEKFNITHGVMIAEVVLLAVSGLMMLSQGGFVFFSEIAKSIFIK